MEQTLVIFKPEALEKHICGNLLSYWDNRNYTIKACKIMTGTEEQFRKHYEEVLQRVSKEIGDGIIERMTRGDCMFLVFEGENVISDTRRFIGVTDPNKAHKFSVRQVYGDSVEYNVVHASDSKENAEREINIWF